MLSNKSLIYSTIFIIEIAVICQGLFIPRAFDKLIKDVPKIRFGNWRPISRPRPSYPIQGDTSATTSNHGHFFPSPEPYFPPAYSKPIRFEENDENSIKHLLNPNNPSDTSHTSLLLSTTPLYPIFVTSGGKNIEFDSTNQSNQNLLQDSEDTISQISENNLFYEETNKLKGKPKLVDGNVENYRPRP